MAHSCPPTGNHLPKHLLTLGPILLTGTLTANAAHAMPSNIDGVADADLGPLANPEMAQDPASTLTADITPASVSSGIAAPEMNSVFSMPGAVDKPEVRPLFPHSLNAPSTKPEWSSSTVDETVEPQHQQLPIPAIANNTHSIDNTIRDLSPSLEAPFLNASILETNHGISEEPESLSEDWVTQDVDGNNPPRDIPLTDIPPVAPSDLEDRQQQLPSGEVQLEEGAVSQPPSSDPSFLPDSSTLDNSLRNIQITSVNFRLAERSPQSTPQNNPTFSCFDEADSEWQGAVSLNDLCSEVKISHPSNTNEEISIGEIVAGTGQERFSLAELYNISEAVTSYYHREGYRTSGAVVIFPDGTDFNAQSVETPITIEITEGTLVGTSIYSFLPDNDKNENKTKGENETINVGDEPQDELATDEPQDELATGKQQDGSATSPESDRFAGLATEEELNRSSPRLARYVRSRLGVQEGEVINTCELQEHLLMLQLDPRVERISAKLADGIYPGTSRLAVEVDEDNVTGSTRIDNGRSPSVGEVQRQVFVEHGSLLGFGDELKVGYTNSDGSNGINGSYTLPINRQNGTVRLGYSNASSNVIEDPFDDLELESASESYEVTLRLPVDRRVSNFSHACESKSESDSENNTGLGNQDLKPTFQEVAIGVTGSVRNSQSRLGEEGFPLSFGAEEDGSTRISALRFFADYARLNEDAVLSASTSFNLGTTAFGATVNDPLDGDSVPDSRFFSWQGQAQWLRRFDQSEDSQKPSKSLLLRASAQLADDALLSAEQFSAGGLGSVRGYRQDTLQTDNGLFATAEVRLPVAQFMRRRGLLQVIPFVDIGTGWNTTGRPDPDEPTLAAAGLGLQVDVPIGGRKNPRELSARLDWGVPLIEVDSRERTLQEHGLHFSLAFNGF
ncbi:MAG: ShlB/FhaC/HecB family hemolysin secretion/activation protein [Cyanobacteria bacterium P01_F01_bin.150]